jgi:hypothetical protein
MPATDPSAISARLTDAVTAGESVELILVLRGKVKPGPRAGRWRIRLQDGHVLSFDAEAVVAATPLARADPRRR